MMATAHTLSTAGGNFVPGASVFGHGNGTAKGGSPEAKVATYNYKVCWPPIYGFQCYDADIKAAFDTAVSDGVDVLQTLWVGYLLNILKMQFK
jgi:hypothetical protein|uniref:Uncharacterized protein n=1 Tax=Fagus sylvatica TaxID=28930 RepID=A0A2N9HAG6_FAGSY